MTPFLSSTRQRRAGFSFVEIIVALALLATVIGSLGLLSQRIATNARLAELFAQRNYVVVQQMNRYGAIPYDSLSKYATAGTQDTIPSGIPKLRFIRRDTVYRVTNGAWDTLRYAVKVVIIPLDSIPSDSRFRDSIMLRRRSPNLSSPLNAAP
jgi:prepilin-type N-terminal cleavage/methylation domain-containing protein